MKKYYINLPFYFYIFFLFLNFVISILFIFMVYFSLLKESYSYLLILDSITDNYYAFDYLNEDNFNEFEVNFDNNDSKIEKKIIENVPFDVKKSIYKNFTGFLIFFKDLTIAYFQIALTISAFILHIEFLSQFDFIEFLKWLFGF